MGLPDKMLLSRRDIVGEATGITVYMWKKMKAAKMLRKSKLPGMKQAKYLRAEVIRVFGIKEGT
jgi:hypothetical protein